MNISILAMALEGYWFCQFCERVTELQDDHRGGNVCARCRSPRVEFRPPVFDPLAVTEV
jgi:hypothetical protein